MAVRFPDFADQSLKSITFCAWVDEVPDGFSADIGDGRTALEARHETANGALMVRLIFNLADEEEAGLHLHIDMARVSWFTDHPPEPTATWDEVAARIEQFFGKTATVRTRARFDLSPEEIPPTSVISLLRQLSGPTARLTGSTFGFTNPEGAELEWSIRTDDDDDDRESIFIKTTIYTEAEVSEGYLVDHLDAATSLFRGFVFDSIPEHSEVDSAES